MLPQDYHLHSNYSCDCQATMDAMCQGAIAHGVAEIGFTEHYDLHPREACRDWLRLEAWAGELAQCRARCAGRLTVRAGVEVGEPHLFAAEAAALVERYPFDYVLGSLHWVGDVIIFDPAYFANRTPAEAFGAYFEELERMVRGGQFDILSHFDVPLRTGFDVYGYYDPLEHEDAIRPVLRAAIERGVALDVNTAALRRDAQMLCPGVEILRWYAEMGGERVTLGSDAHRPHHVGYGLDLALDAIRAAGLKYLTFFEQREARLEKLPALA